MNSLEYYRSILRKNLKNIIPLIFFESLSLLGIVSGILGFLSKGYLIASIVICAVSYFCLVYILISALREFHSFKRLNPPEDNQRFSIRKGRYAIKRRPLFLWNIFTLQGALFYISYLHCGRWQRDKFYADKRTQLRIILFMKNLFKKVKKRSKFATIKRNCEKG